MRIEGDLHQSDAGIFSQISENAQVAALFKPSPTPQAGGDSIS
ncbi:hypothetical protein [Cyanobium sp. T1B-Tous]|nr:hypothetical protein [Cyanobium sp. T1B-Tous]